MFLLQHVQYVLKNIFKNYMKPLDVTSVKNMLYIAVISDEVGGT